MYLKDKINNFLDIAQAVGQRSECMKDCCGAIIVKDDIIAATGYIMLPRGCVSCESMGECALEKGSVCRCISAETAAVLNLPQGTADGKTMYISCQCVEDYFPDCESRKLILNADIARVIIRRKNGGFVSVNTDEWIK